MVTAIILFDGNLAFGTRSRELLDFLLRLLILHSSFSTTTLLKLSACLIFVPIGLAENAVLVPAGPTAKDGLGFTTCVQLSCFASGREAMAVVSVLCKSCPERSLLIPEACTVSTLPAHGTLSLLLLKFFRGCHLLDFVIL